MRSRLRSTALLLLLFAGCTGTQGVTTTPSTNPVPSTQEYPDKPVRIIEPFGVGGGPDLLARALAPQLSRLWGQPVTVENIPGAGATAGPALVARSPADGYTLLLNTSAQAYSAALMKNLSYDPLKDFTPIASLTSQPYVLVAGKSAGVTTVRELIAAAHRKPEELRFASTGPGSGTHLAVVKFNREAGIRAVDVPPEPTAAIADVLAGTIEGRTTYMIAPISIAIPAIRDGQLAALGVTTTRRSALLPEVPTISEAGVAGYDFPIWYGIWVRAGTPAGVVDRLSKDIARALAAPALRDWVTEHGGEMMSMTQPEFARFVQSESESASRLSEAIGTKH
jgi:tripartite-type tricarboxylate transporter receptor subunit TctC